MAKRTIKINIKLPAGIIATPELIKTATKAAEDVVNASASDLIEAQKLAKELVKKGVQITAEEILARKSVTRKKTGSKASKKSVTASSTRKRVVLEPAQRKALIAELKSGAKIAAAAKKFGISTATVMNIKTSAGLTKSRKK
ncbi:MAG: hypothetical protein AAGH40_09090 [Verrucomicrobiota bacterium]